MRRFILVLAISLSLSGILVAQSQPPLPQPMDSLLEQGIDLIMQQQYERALGHFRQLAVLYPHSPEGYLFQAAVLQTRAIDYRTFPDKEKFDSLLVLTRSIAETMVDTNANSPWGHYYLGTALGMQSYDKIQRGEYVSGYMKGRSAVSSLEKALELDTTIYDAYSVLGTYYYWKTRKMGFLNWLPFVRDDRAKGIEYLHRAIERGRYQRFAALSNLLWSYIDANDLQKAEAVARTALQRYPEHRIFLHGLAGALHNQGKYTEALAVYERQLKSILSDNTPNPYNELGCRVNILFVKVALKDTTRLQEHLNAIVGLQRQSFPPYLREKVEEKFQQARRFEKLLTNGKISSH